MSFIRHGFNESYNNSIASLRAENDRLIYDHVLKMQLQEEKLRKELTDTFQETIQSNLKQCEERHEKKIQMLNREFEAKVCQCCSTMLLVNSANFCINL